MTGHSRIPPFYAVGFLIVLATHAGMHYGLDKLLVERLERLHSALGRFGAWILNLSLPAGTRRIAVQVIAAVGMYFLLQSVVAESRFRMVSLDLTVLMALSALGLAVGAGAANRAALIGRLTGAFVGYRFLHEIWIRSVPALNGLPGWATAEKLAAPFAIVAEKHFALFGWLTRTLILPGTGFWLYVFGIAQVTVGLALILGVRSRWAGRIGIGYLAFLMLFGFTRYTPFILGLLIFAHATDANGWLGPDGVLTRSDRSAAPPIIGTPWLVALAAIVVISILVAVLNGIIPGDYRDRMGAVVGAMTAIVALPLLATAIFQRANRTVGLRSQ